MLLLSVVRQVVALLTSTPCSINRGRASVRPLATAKWKADKKPWPWKFNLKTSAPSSINRSIFLSLPPSAAWWNGVHPWESHTSREAPLSTRKSTTSSSLNLEANIRGVSPDDCIAVELTCSPQSRTLRRWCTCPLLAARCIKDWEWQSLKTESTSFLSGLSKTDCCRFRTAQTDLPGKWDERWPILTLTAMALSSLLGLWFKMSLKVPMSPWIQANCSELRPCSLSGVVTAWKAKDVKDSCRKKSWYVKACAHDEH